MIYMLFHSQLRVVCGVGLVVGGVLRVVAWCACVLANIAAPTTSLGKLCCQLAGMPTWMVAAAEHGPLPDTKNKVIKVHC